jgi:cellulose synthase/poly-beta-1,6-N-acetylglucosamine synthase-like glycosyltransferase
VREANRTSVVIVNKGERTLSDTLEALKGFVGNIISEVLVVDASNLEMDDVRLANEWARWIDYAQPPGVRSTIAQQRNIGVRSSEGDIIVFTDSGCVPEDGWLERLLEPILQEGESVSCGPVRALGESVYRWMGNPDDDYVSKAATINMAFRREAFEVVGGFDETFGAGEDIDFSWRLADHGFRIRWVHGAVVQHDFGTSIRQVRRAFFYGKGTCRLLRKHPHRIVEATNDNSVPVVYALFLLGLPLTLKWRWYPLLVFLPIWHRRERFRWLVLLDHLFQGLGALHEWARPGT